MKLKHFKELDGVRGIAALMIIFFHFFQGLGTHENAHLILIKKYAAIGQTGVSLFFVLSGFLITRILLNSKRLAHYFKNFYIRRALRIFPLYYFFLLFFYFILPFFENSSPVSFSHQLWYWIYLQNIPMTLNLQMNGPGHFWSLAVEEHFYFFWPFVVYYLNIKKITNAILLIIILVFITRIFLELNDLKTFYFTFARMDELAVGALLAIWEIKGRLKPGNSNRFVLLFISIILPTLILWTFTGGEGYKPIQVVKFIVLAFFYFSFIGLIITVKDNNWIKRIFKTPVLIYTGKISYGLYVWHPLCFGIVSRYYKTSSILALIIISFCFCYVIASLSYYLFESKFLLLKKKFEYSKV